MTMSKLRQRWTTPRGRQLQGLVGGWLASGGRGEPPKGVERHEGRWDIRGFPMPDSDVLGNVSVGGSALEEISGLSRFTGVKWSSLDLSDARLPNLRIFASSVSNCRFDGADCRDLRLWDTSVSDSSFVGANLRDAALGTWHEGRSNTWSRVTFDGADARGVLMRGGSMLGCTFDGTRLGGAAFQQPDLGECVFAGKLQDVLFDGREIRDRPVPEPLRHCDFTDAVLADVEFRGCRFDDVALPDDPDIRVLSDYPAVARRALALSEAASGLEARMFAGELRNSLKLPGAPDSVSVFNRRDYLASGGEAFADFAEAILMEAAGHIARDGRD